MPKKAKPSPAYQQLVDAYTPKKKILRNCLVAWISGGALCALAEAADYCFQQHLQLSEAAAGSRVLLLIIGITALLTGIGVYDKLGQKLGAGLAVPISGFANSVSASMLEHRFEGLVLGSGCNSFKLAGAVMVFGIASAFFVALAAWILGAV